MKFQDLFLAARDYIRDHGWTQGRLKDDRTGAVCLEGAVREASYDLRMPITDPLDKLSDYVWQERNICGTTSLNDDWISSEDEACDVLEGAAKWVAEQETE